MRIKIYYLTDNTNIPRYIGKTKGILINRLNEHKSETRNSKKQTHKINWIKRADYNIKIELIEECDYCDWVERERYWISEYIKNGYNLTNCTSGWDTGHNGYKGRKCSDDTKIKLSKANKGRIISEEWRNKIGESNKGKKKSDEARNKLSKSKTGKKVENYKSHNHSEETKSKISIANKGKKRTIEQIEHLKNVRLSMQVVCPYCNKKTYKSNATRYHFEKCKLKNNLKIDVYQQPL